MQFKNINILVLLFVISFSVFHEIEFAMQDKEPCDVVEYVSEFNAPTDCGDVCEIHYEYHHPYLVPSYDTVVYLNTDKLYNIPQNTSYSFKTHSKTIKPPIA
jgi:hypothetical protein